MTRVDSSLAVPHFDLPIERTVDSVMAERRAASFTKRSIKASTKEELLRLGVSMIDLTTLEGKDSPEKVRALCRKAISPLPGFEPTIPSVAAICVYPALVATACEALRGSSVKVASVATAFPSGQFPLQVRIDDVRRAVEAGAHEIDMVISRGAFLSGEFRRVADEIYLVKRACGHAHLKVILETGELETLDAVRFASDLAIEACLAASKDRVLEKGDGDARSNPRCFSDARRANRHEARWWNSHIKIRDCAVSDALRDARFGVDDARTLSIRRIHPTQ